MVAASSSVYDSVQKLFGQKTCCKSGRGTQVKALFPKKRKHDRSSYGAKLSTMLFSRYARARFEVLRQGVLENWHRIVNGRANTSVVKED